MLTLCTGAPLIESAAQDRKSVVQGKSTVTVPLLTPAASKYPTSWPAPEGAVILMFPIPIRGPVPEDAVAVAVTTCAPTLNAAVGIWNVHPLFVNSLR